MRPILKTLPVFLLAIGLCLSRPGLADSAAVRLLKDVPLKLTALAAKHPVPDRLATAQEVLNLLQAIDSQMVHMELLRRAALELDAAQKQALLAALEKKYKANNTNPKVYFDHGYAQLVFRDNQTGLFFLRKANDALHTPGTALAYAMAQADVDLNQEKAPPAQMNTRKLDVTFKLADAIRNDMDQQQPGFWPSFVAVIERLKTIPAYHDFAFIDFSRYYVPFGRLPTTEMSRPTAVTALPCVPAASGVQAPAPTSLPIKTMAMDVNADGRLDTLALYPAVAGQYTLRVTDADNRLLLQTESAVATAYVMEDLNADRQYELVIRQYKANALDPVRVYRLKQCRFELDEKIRAMFSS